MQMHKSHPVKKSKFSSSKHVLALPLWTPDTLHYSFADITVGAQPYYSELKEENILENHQAARQGMVLALELTPEVMLLHMDTSRALQRYGQDVKQHMSEHYHSNCRCLWGPMHLLISLRECLINRFHFKGKSIFLSGVLWGGSV